MNLSDTDLFYSSALLFSEESLKRLTDSKAAIAGIGGVGSIVVEMLARHGIGFLRLAEPDCYETRNLNRQIFATTDTIGKNKAMVGADRVKLIHPGCRVEVFEEGVTLSNVGEFVEGMEVILGQTDTESSKIIIHRMAKKMKIPVICGSRDSIFGHRWSVKAKVWNYKKYPDLPCYDAINHPEWANIPLEEMTRERLDLLDEKVRKRKMEIFDCYAKSNPALFGSIDQTDLLKRINGIPDYDNRHVCAVLANTAGCLAAASVLKLLLDGPEEDLEINLWNGNGSR